MNATRVRWCITALVCCSTLTAWAQDDRSQIGRELAIPRHLQDGEEYQITIPQLIAFGERLFTAKWTSQEGQGRPNTKGTAAAPPLSNPSDPLVFPRNFNRISGLDPNAEPLDQNQPAGTPKFFAGNAKFLTRKLWGVGNSAPYLRHGKFTTRREAILAHVGEALAARPAFEALSSYDRECIIEFLKTLQILPPNASRADR